MSDLKPKGIEITINGVDRRILFTLNAIDKIQEKYGKPLHEVIDEITKFDLSNHALRDVLLILLEDEAERESVRNACYMPEEMTEKEMGWFLSLENQVEVTKLVLMAYGVSLPEPDESDPNVESGQQNN